MKLRKIIDKGAFGEFLSDISEKHGFGFINEIGDSIDKYKFQIIIGIVFATIFVGYQINKMDENSIQLFDNLIFKVIMFGIVTFLFSENTTIAVFLAIALLVIYQLVSNRKFIIELVKEEYTPINGFFYNSNEQNKQNVSCEINLNPITLQSVYHNMILEGIEKIKAGEIVEGKRLVSSGVNRLQQANQGQLSSFEKLLNYSALSYVNTQKIIDLYVRFKKHPDVTASWKSIEDILYKLNNTNLDYQSYNKLLKELYSKQLEFLEIVLRYNVKNMTPNKVQESQNIVNNLKKTDKKKNKHWLEKIEILGDLLL
jgi:hypothetical protein